VAKGHLYEKQAEKYLTDNGYLVLEKNWQAGHKEIDLIAEKDNTIVFIEVKGAADKKYGHPSEKVDRRKRDHLIDAAEQYIASKNLSNRNFRFDLITILDGQLEYYPNAFQRE
jgi:putative endonuclease